MTYCEELKLMIYDKLLLGIILLVFGLVINKLLEKYKANLSIIKEFTILKISKISNTWNILIEFEEESQIIIEKVLTIRKFLNSIAEQTKEIIKETSKLDDNLKIKIDLVNRTLQQNHFWIGNEYYKRFSNYRDSIIEYYQAVIQNRDIDFDEMKMKMNNKKEDLINIVKENLKQ